MTQLQKAQEIHTSVIEAVDRLIESGDFDPDYREIAVQQELLDENVTEYLVYRAISTPVGSMDPYSPTWFTYGSVKETLRGFDVSMEDAKAAVDSLLSRTVILTVGDMGIAYPLLPVFAVVNDVNGEDIYFAPGHGPLGANIMSVLRYVKNPEGD